MNLTEYDEALDVMSAEIKRLENKLALRELIKILEQGCKDNPRCVRKLKDIKGRTFYRMGLPREYRE